MRNVTVGSDPSSKVDTPVKAVLLDHLRVAWVVPGEALVGGRVLGGWSRGDLPI